MTLSPRYLWFAANAGLWPSFRMEHRLADALARAGRPVTMIRCDGVLDSYCPVMSADRLRVDSSASEKAEACRECTANSEHARAVGAYDTVRLEDAVTGDVTAAADRIAAAVTHDNWLDLEWDGLPIGRWAAYTSMLQHKLPDVTSSGEVWLEYVSDVRNTLLVAGAMPALLEATRPTHAVVYNGLYPTHRVFAAYAQRAGARFVGLHAGGFIPARYETVGIYQHVSASQTVVDSPTIRAALDIPCTPAEVAAVGEQLRELTAGNDPWVYSAAPRREAPDDLRARLGLRPTAPVVVALLSSPDETRASMLVGAEYHRAPERGYSDIAEFITAVRTLAESLPEVDVVLRLHPRLSPNKRESVLSPDLADILVALEGLPPNAHVNSPGHGVSLYDLIGIASAAVNQSSSAGLEFLALGLPVVSFDPVRQGAYPPEFGPCVERADPEGLAAAVSRAVTDGRNPAYSVRAFRWYATVYCRALLHLAPLVVDAAVRDGSEQAYADPDPQVGMRGPLGGLVRRVVPETLRERAARRLARRGRLASLPDPHDDTAWRAEWLMRVDSIEGDDVVWTPPITVRGIPAPLDEEQDIHRTVADLVEQLGFRSGEGFGPVVD